MLGIDRALLPDHKDNDSRPPTLAGVQPELHFPPLQSILVSEAAIDTSPENCIHIIGLKCSQTSGASI